MAKYADFGGLPESRFDNYADMYSVAANLPLLTDKQRVEVLVALAREEHAAARSAGDSDVIAVVMQCMEVEEQHRKIVNGGTDVTAFVGSLNDLKGLW